jgi:short-subunit dehydrogenase
VTEPRQPLRVAIFGATSGIAQAVSRLYAARGAALVLVGRDRPALEDEAADLRIRGAASVEVSTADFSDTNIVVRSAAEAFDAMGGLDVALVAYGALPDQSAAQTDPHAAANALLLNFVSPALLAGELANRFETQRSGTIAVITSVAGDRGRQSNYIYGAAKGGLQRFLEGLRHRLFSAGVGVLDIRPGFVSTRMTAHLPRTGPLWAEPDLVAKTVVAAIDGNRSVLYTPWFWRPVMTLVRGVPAFLFHRSKL